MVSRRITNISRNAVKLSSLCGTGSKPGAVGILERECFGVDSILFGLRRYFGKTVGSDGGDSLSREYLAKLWVADEKMERSGEQRRPTKPVKSKLGETYQAPQLSPPPQSVGLVLNEAPVSSSRIRLSDGRYLAYREIGVPRNQSSHTIIIVHGFGSSKDMNFLAPQELLIWELVEELGLCFLIYDRAGYGESDPNPRHSVKSAAYDIGELADQLQIGSKFHLIGVSIGSYATWSCLKYIPDRLAGVAFIAPVVNYQWPSFPENLISLDYRRILVQTTLWMAKYAPGLLYWWATQEWFPSTNVLVKNPFFFNNNDIEVLKKTKGFPMLTKDRLRDRCVFDLLRDDFLVGFGDWEFDLMELSNPFPQNESSVHIWQGYEDKVVPFQLQRYIATKLPWIKYHEVADGGHLIMHYSGLCESVLRVLFVGEDHHLYNQVIRPH